MTASELQRPHPAPAMARPGAIELIGVAKRYQVGDNTVTAVAGVDLDIPPASFVVILGPSGSGKTTLLNLIGALDVPTEGTVRVDGQDVGQAGPEARFELRRKHVTFIFQTFNLFPALTALENVQFGADVAGQRDAAGTAARVLDEVGLGARRQHFPSQLSGGEQQRVAIARALATGNPIILADEPTGELDYRTGVQILGLLLEQSRLGKTIVVVTHNREIARAADRVVELSSGRIVGDGPPPGGTVAVDSLRW